MFDTGCCGADFRTKRVTLTGLLTLSVPMIYLAAPAALLLGPLLKGRTQTLLRVLWTANLELVHRTALAPALRCSLAGALYPLSPRFSGAVYRNFNLSVLTALWAILLGASYLVIKWIT